MKWIINWYYQKMSITKIVLLNHYSLMKERMRKIRMTLRVKFWHFLTPSLYQFSKFNDSIWVCWFLGKNLSNFVSPAWKLDNPYCHILHWKLQMSLTHTIINNRKWIKIQVLQDFFFHLVSFFFKVEVQQIIVSLPLLFLKQYYNSCYVSTMMTRLRLFIYT